VYISPSLFITVNENMKASEWWHKGRNTNRIER
jgi:hypothetical protein